ncbi:A/G-specific adenine glycosylase [Candidatus Finniella inopinata]|uniref:Adenine DNA glycosylase n=2 Tax=Candidatus Finniella inopinata TaxID=1696036 RepID=A0A4V2E033_9PROT|nr:A/G-specific adenine glycosylase [Candidatus Finniella inopinata]
MDIAAFRHRLLHWYDSNRRTLPWRALKGQKPNPYHVLLSEIMLQQTTVATVIAYFERFIGQWPTLEAMAKASLDDVLVAWQGLGYYSRARNLHKALGQLADLPSFPQTPDDLRKLPGVGDYTAKAIASIAFDQPVVPVDGNVIRVVARVFGLTQALPMLKKTVAEKALLLAADDRPGDFAQSLMDLGSMICRPQQPRCDRCPLRSLCKGYEDSLQHTLPIKAVKPPKPTRYGCAFLTMNKQGQIWLRRRPEKGLLGGMIEVPGTAWAEQPTELVHDGLWRGIVKHTFTHFHLNLSVYETTKDPEEILGFPTGFWADTKALDQQALPTVMKKVLAFLRPET